MNATSEPDPKLKEQDGPHDAAGGAVLIPHDVVPAISPKLPVPLPPELPRHRRLLRRAVILLLLLAVGAVGGAIYWL